MPGEHAKLSASAAHRWLNCTAAPAFEAQFPESESPYAAEGTLAHSVCEYKINKLVIQGKAKCIIPKKYRDDELYSDEMDATSDIYAEYVRRLSMGFSAKPFIATEIRVDFSEYVPEGFGTCDCLIIGGDLMHIIDYKHGKGVPVSAEENPQMQLYALGALDMFSALYPDVKQVTMSIVQPRLRAEADSWTTTADELRQWGESIKPTATEAFSGEGKFNPGDHCRFCRGKAECRARAEQFSALNDFKGILPDRLSDAEIGQCLANAKQLSKWVSDLEEYATSKLARGEKLPGWKLVEGRSNRAFTNTDKAFEKLINDGYDEALLYDRKPKTLSEVEKLLGKKTFAEELSDFVIKPPGKPTLVPESDKRPELSSAQSDFADIK